MAEKLLGIVKYFAVLPRIGGEWEDFKALWKKDVYIWDVDGKICRKNRARITLLGSENINVSTSQT